MRRVCNVDRYGMTLQPLEYGIKQKGHTLIPYQGVKRHLTRDQNPEG